MKITHLKNINVFFISCLFFLISGCTTTKNIQETPFNSAKFQQNVHYKKVSPPLPVSTHKIEVVEMFFYACPHCNELEAKIKPWLDSNKGSINFKRIPAILGPSWADQARAYYIAEKLDVIDTIHPALLKAIHQDKRKFYNEISLMEFFIEQGIDKQTFINAYNSAYVAEKVNNARIMTVKYGLRGIPAIIVNGQYKTAPFYLSPQVNTLDVVDYLIAKVQFESKK